MLYYTENSTLSHEPYKKPGVNVVDLERQAVPIVTKYFSYIMEENTGLTTICCKTEKRYHIKWYQEHSP